MLLTYLAAITFSIAACLKSCLMNNTATANLVRPMITDLTLGFWWWGFLGVG